MTLRSVSVVIISRNEGRRLESTVRNVLRTLPADGRELIVVDDGSTDDSFKFLRRLREVHVVRSKGIGVAKARNFGASHANGDVIVFCDAHMKLPPRWHRALIEPLESREVGAVAPGIYSVTHPRRRACRSFRAACSRCGETCSTRRAASIRACGSWEATTTS